MRVDNQFCNLSPENSSLQDLEHPHLEESQNIPILISLHKTFESILSAWSQSLSSTCSDPLSSFARTTSGTLPTFFYEVCKYLDSCSEEIQEDKEKLFSFLISEISKRRETIALLKERWSSYYERHQDAEFARAFQLVLAAGSLHPCSEGCGCAYFLMDSSNRPRFIVKPIDEDIFCLNNRKGFAIPFDDTSLRVRDDIPMYRSAQTDLLAYLVAQDLGLEHITPKAGIFVVHSDAFYDFTDGITLEKRDKVIELSGAPMHDKLCSFQEFVPNSSMAYDKFYEWFSQGYDEEYCSQSICPQDFENVHAFLWTTFDNDAHFGNFLLFPKFENEQGETLYGIKKVDNGLSFPEKNSGFTNHLMHLPLAQRPISDALRNKLLSIPDENIIAHIKDLGLSEDCVRAFCVRSSILKQLAQRPHITIYEINLRLMLLEKVDGVTIALSDLNTEQLSCLLSELDCCPSNTLDPTIY